MYENDNMKNKVDGIIIKKSILESINTSNTKRNIMKTLINESNIEEKYKNALLYILC